MTESLDELPIDSSTEPGTMDFHLLSVQVAMINQITQATQGKLVLDDVLHLIALQLPKTLQVSGCLIVQSNRLSKDTGEAGEDDRLYTVCRDLYQYYYSWLALGKLVMMPPTAQEIPQAIRDSVNKSSLSRLLIVPLLYQQSFLGGIVLYQCENQREWTSQEIALVQAIAEHCAIALTFTTLQQRFSTELHKRKDSELALQASVARNRALLEAVPDLLFRVSRDGIYLDWKDAQQDILPLQNCKIIGKHLHNCLPTEVAGLIWQHVELALETNEIQIVEYSLWLNSKSHNFEARIVKSGCDEVVVIVQDITERVQARVALEQLNDILESRINERTVALRMANRTLRAEIVDRKRIEKELRASEERFRQAVVHAPFPIIIHAEDGEVLQLNQVWTELTGYTQDEIRSISDWMEKAYEATPATIRDRIAQLYNQPNPGEHGEFTVKTKQGENRIWHFSCAPLGQLSDGRRLIISMATDVTERKQTEKELHFWYSIRQAIFETQDFHAALSVAIQKVCEATGWDFGEAWVPKTDGSVLECSPAWFSKTKCLESFRRASENMTFAPGIGVPGRVWVLQQPEWRRDVSAESDQVYLRAQMAKEAGLKAALGIPLLTTSGVIAVLVFYMFESKDEDERLIELISASTELGLMIQRKQADEDIRQSLEREKELTELKSRFISMTSHEFRTPLTTIQSSTELLERYSSKLSDERKLTHLHRIQKSVQHMTKLLNDVLILGKAEAGKLEFNPAPLNLENFCCNLVEELQVNDNNQHTINFTLNQGRGETGDNVTSPLPDRAASRYTNVRPLLLSSVFPAMDEKLLRQILENLLSNAIKYSPQGSTIGFTLCCFWDRAVFQISDKGIGIPAEDQPLLFETFHRANNVGTIAGTGLGLAIVKKCADIHQAQITVESEIGVGTTFTVTLPIYHWLPTHEQEKNISH
ncbi:MAG TPA: ATP-binding protein [Coleofasciculaceae cyanobacterium]